MGLLIVAIQRRMDGRDRAEVLGGAVGGSPELSLALAPVGLFQRGLVLHGLWSMGILTEVLEGVGGDR
jgi:hypothetical protein